MILSMPGYSTVWWQFMDEPLEDLFLQSSPAHPDGHIPTPPVSFDATSIRERAGVGTGMKSTRGGEGGC